MEGNKLELSGTPNNDTSTPTATYKPIPEADMEEDAVSRPKNLVKPKSASPEVDGADEKMLPKEETKIAPNSNIATGDAKIILNEKQNGDAKLDICEEKKTFGGMSKEELMKYANDPFWVKVRWFLFILFWVLWAAMLMGAVLIIYAAPKCDPPPPRTWWEEGPLTEINSDIQENDLKALKQKGVKGVIISYSEDVYSPIDDDSDILRLMQQSKANELAVVVDLEPGSSNVWFNKSEERDMNYTNYYIWKSSKNENQEPPNNWLTINNTSSWKYSEKRKEFYYSLGEKPQLNFRNENVTKEFTTVIKTFLDKGASGIRLRNAPYLLVDPKFEDEIVNQFAKDRGLDLKEYEFYQHTKTEHLSDLGPLLKEWRKVVKNKTDNGLFTIAEELSHIESYKVNTSLVIDLPLQSRVFSKPYINVSETVITLNNSLMIDGLSWPLWKANTTAVPKDVINIVTYLLPGAPLIDRMDLVDEHLLKIRASPSIMRGSCKYNSVSNNTVLAFIREIAGNPGILVAFNPSNEKSYVNFPNEIPELSKIEEVTVQYYSNNYNETEFSVINKKERADKVPISPKSAIVLSYVPKKEE